MKRKRILVALGVLGATLVACSSEDGSGSGMAPPGWTGASGSAALPRGAGGPSARGGEGLAGTCSASVPATSQIPRLLNRQYEAIVRDLLGVTTLGSDDKTAAQLLVADSDGPMTPDAWRIYQDVGSQIARAVMTGPSRSRFIGCDAAAAGCLEQTIRAFGRKAFRRPLTDAEVARFQRLGQTMPAGTPDEVAEATLLAFLVSPSFLLVPELQTAPDPLGAGIQLSSHEAATRLSFLLWGSVPDDALNAAADAGKLQTRDQILAEAERMIGVREKTGRLIAAFHRDWVQMNNGNAHWWKVDHDPKIYPLFDERAKSTLQAELDAFFEEVAFSGGSFEDLLLSDVAFVNAATAPIYGLPAAQFGADLTKVQLDAAQRPGFLTRAGFLGSYAGYDATSPILRGAFITVYMLGVDPGPPIPGVTRMTLSGDFKTQRAYVEALTKPAQCAGCHSGIINPPGFVMENYDGIGKWQTIDPRGGAIDASVTTASVNFGDGRVESISSPLSLMQGIARTPKARRLYAEAWVSYAFGRAPNASDACIVDRLEAKLSQSDYSILELLDDLTQADAFRVRVRANP